MFEIPSNFKNNFYIYTSKTIFEECNLKQEYKELKKEGKVRNYNQLATHMALIINYLSYKLNDKHIKNIHRKKLQEVSSSALYRTCINILKKHKLLFICSRNGKESYVTGSYSKGYKFNITEYRLRNDSPIKIKVKDHRIVKKVISRVDELQIPKNLRDFFTQEEVEQNIYRPKVRKNKPNLKDIFKNVQIISKTISCNIYSLSQTITNKEKSKKHWLLHKIRTETPFELCFRDLKETPIRMVSQLYHELVGVYGSITGQKNRFLHQYVRENRYEMTGYYELSFFNYNPMFQPKRI